LILAKLADAVREGRAALPPEKGRGTAAGGPANVVATPKAAPVPVG